MYQHHSPIVVDLVASGDVMRWVGFSKPTDHLQLVSLLPVSPPFLLFIDNTQLSKVMSGPTHFQSMGIIHSSFGRVSTLSLNRLSLHSGKAGGCPFCGGRRLRCGFRSGGD